MSATMAPNSPESATSTRTFRRSTLSEMSSQAGRSTPHFRSWVSSTRWEIFTNRITTALQVTFTGRNYHGFTFLAGYTYSHALDDVGANWDFGAGSGLPMDSYHPQREYASSDYDMRHRFTLSATYAIPGRQGFCADAGRMAGQLHR